MEKDYLGPGGYINGLGFRVKGERPVTISKSILSDLDEDEEYYIDEYGIKRRRKKGMTELSDIDVEEVSYVDSPATRKKFIIIKGDEKEMDVEKEMTTGEVKTIQATIGILKKYKVTGDLEKAKGLLEKYFPKGAYPYPYPSKVKKSDNFYWPTAERQIYGYNQDDLAMIKDSEIEEVEKSTKDNPFPSLTRVFNRNTQNMEECIEEENIEDRLI